MLGNKIYDTPCTTRRPWFLLHWIKHVWTCTGFTLLNPSCMLLYIPLLYSSALCWWTCDPRSELWGAPLRQRTHRTCPRRWSRCRTRSGTSKHTDTICSTDSQAANGHNITSENRHWMYDRGSMSHKIWNLPPVRPQTCKEAPKPLRNGYQSSLSYK